RSVSTSRKTTLTAIGERIMARMHWRLWFTTLVVGATVGVACSPGAPAAPTAPPAAQPTAASAAPKPTNAPVAPATTAQPTTVAQATTVAGPTTAAKPAQAAAGQPQIGGTVTIPIAADPTMNPWHPNAFVESIFVNRVLFDSLTRPGKDLAPAPDLARTWEAAADGLSWTFTLRDDPRWSDGQALT